MRCIVVFRAVCFLALALMIPCALAAGPVPNVSWSKTFGGTDNDAAWSVIQTSDGGYALAGATASYGAGGADLWLVKTDSSGNMEWNKTFGGENNDWATSVIQTSDGGYALAGYTYSYGAGWSDFWLVKLSGPKSEEFTQRITYVVMGAIIVVIVALVMVLYKRHRG